MHRFTTPLFKSIALAMFLMLGVLAYAQDGPPPDGPPPGEAPMPQRLSPQEAAAQDLKQLSKKLKLTNDQKSQIRPILEDQHARMSALFQSQPGGPPSEDTMSKMKEIQEGASGRIRAVLTDEQKADYDKIAQKMEQRAQPPPE